MFLNKLTQNQKGLSLIELIVAFSIIAIAFISLTQAFPFGLSVSKEAENKTIASYLAQSKIEELYSVGYSNISTGIIENTDHLSDNSSSYLYSYKRMATVSYVDESMAESVSDKGIKKISITVTYPSGGIGAEKTFIISTLISEN